MKSRRIIFFSIFSVSFLTASWLFLRTGIFKSDYKDNDLIASEAKELKVEGVTIEKENNQEELKEKGKKIVNKNNRTKLSVDVKKPLEKKVKIKKSTDNFFTGASLLETNPDAPKRKAGWDDAYSRSHSAVAIDVATGTILYNQKATQQRPIASLTKMMTAIIVEEKIDDLKNEIVTIDKEVLSTQGSKVGCPSSTYCDSNRLELGEKVTAKDLLESMLIASTNDAAVALARHISGSQEKFAELMNKKAKELGLKDSHFCNPTGLDIEGEKCYSSAYDLARISAYSMRYVDIWKALKKKEKTFSAINKAVSHTVKNTNRLLDKMSNCDGAKTGFTYEAGRTLMVAAHHPNNKKNKVIAVMLDNAYRWQDMPELLNWCFNAYDWE